MSEEVKEVEELSLTTSQSVLEKRITEETGIDELKNIVDLFNLNIQKKNILRTGKLSELQDKIYSEIEERLDKHAGEFSNKDLLDYFKAVQETLNKSNSVMEDLNTPKILLNQQNVNVTIEDNSLSKESRKRVADVVAQLLADSKNIDQDMDEPLDEGCKNLCVSSKKDIINE